MAKHLHVTRREGELVRVDVETPIVVRGATICGIPINLTKASVTETVFKARGEASCEEDFARMADDLFGPGQVKMQKPKSKKLAPGLFEIEYRFLLQ